MNLPFVFPQADEFRLPNGPHFSRRAFSIP